MAQITNLTATTELEALNAMLSAIGEAPVASVDTAVAQVDALMAVNILRDTAREVQRRGWEFNYEEGLTILPSVTNFAWTDPDGTAQVLNIYTPPASLIRFGVTGSTKQIGKGIDLVIRPSRIYTAGAPLAPVMIFYDRSKNRDGLIAADFPSLQIDATWLFNFEQCPDSIRRYITLVAARRFIQQVLGSNERAGFTADDEKRAAVEAFRDQAPASRENLLNEPTVAMVLGNRPRYQGPAVFDIRYNP